MIRLNDINKTVIDEKAINTYGVLHLGISLLIGDFGLKLEYETNEVRDKDIELLDKIFDVKDIEYKAMSVAKPTGYVNVMKPKYELVSEGEYDPVKKEEYLTWKDVSQYATSIKAEMPNGDIRNVFYNNSEKCIGVKSYYRNDCGAYIYDDDLFNALMLKKVE